MRAASSGPFCFARHAGRSICWAGNIVFAARLRIQVSQLGDTRPSSLEYRQRARTPFFCAGRTGVMCGRYSSPYFKKAVIYTHPGFGESVGSIYPPQHRPSRYPWRRPCSVRRCSLRLIAVPIQLPTRFMVCSRSLLARFCCWIGSLEEPARPLHGPINSVAARFWRVAN